MNRTLKKEILSDLYRYGYKSEKAMSCFDRMENYGYRYTKVLRKTKYYKNRSKILYYINRLYLQHLMIKYGFSIPYSVEIGEGLYLGHLGSIVINASAKLGSNVNIAQGVTIGIANGGEKPGVPQVGNRVWIGANATVVGGIKIGDDVMIAPNTFVNFDVPDHSIVIGTKATIINKENATNNYVNNIVENL